ncbi:MAG: DUF4249 domain-containing protein [Siphonobacter sp.]
MNRLFLIIMLLGSMGLLTSCEDVIHLSTETGPTRLVVDGWITNEATRQSIRLTLSQNYFDNTQAIAVLGATVTVTDETAKVFEFIDTDQSGNYVWTPAGTETLGKIGGSYTLKVTYDSETYEATTQLKRIPTIDSLTYFYEKPTIAPSKGPSEGYTADFYARDFVGVGDCYWIRTYLNGVRYDKDATDLSPSYDGSFSAGSSTDGQIFILPVRRCINMNQYFSENDTITVELYSITQPGFYFLQAIQKEASNQGLFATAPANIPTNITNTRSDGPTALGWFGAAAISRFTTVVKKENASPKPD